MNPLFFFNVLKPYKKVRSFKNWLFDWSKKNSIYAVKKKKSITSAILSYEVNILTYKFNSIFYSLTLYLSVSFFLINELTMTYLLWINHNLSESIILNN